MPPPGAIPQRTLNGIRHRQQVGERGPEARAAWAARMTNARRQRKARQKGDAAARVFG
jgi:hypothetical protein